MTRTRKVALTGGILGVLTAAIAVPMVNAAGTTNNRTSTSAAVLPRGACATIGNQQACLAPVVIDLSSKCPRWPNGSQTIDRTDANNVAQQATLSNGTTPCVRVSYATPPDMSKLAKACKFYFYVPAQGFANAPVTFGWWNTSGEKHYAATIQEAGISGWTQLNMQDPTNTGSSEDPQGAAGVTRLDFQDNNGATYMSSYIGWGKQASHGIEEVC